MKKKRLTLREIRFGTLVSLSLGWKGKIYLYNSCDKTTAILLQKDGTEKRVDWNTSVFFCPEKEGMIFFSEWSKSMEV
jgi:hypothetical protein